MKVNLSAFLDFFQYSRGHREEVSKSNYTENETSRLNDSESYDDLSNSDMQQPGSGLGLP